MLEKAWHTPKLGWYRYGIRLRRKDGDQPEHFADEELSFFVIVVKLTSYH